jgi:menaquinone-dependent protoporphyrinogen oxidase
MAPALSRRKFLTESAMVAGGTLTALALGAEFSFPQPAEAATIEFPESSCGLKQPNVKRTLVAYASRCGSTGGVAEAIGKTLCNGQATVDVRLIEHVQDIHHYGAIVIGSAIRAGKWLPEATAFVQENRERLIRVPVAYFLTCLALFKGNEQNRKKALAYMEPVRDRVPEIKPVSVGAFAGVLDYGKLNFAMRVVMKRKMKSRGVPEGDFRNWKAIKAWAKDLQNPLQLT